MDALEDKKKAVFDKIKKLVFDDASQPDLKSGKSQIHESDLLEKRTGELLQKIKSGQANWIYWLGLVSVLLIGWYVRTRNLALLAGKYLIELDSYFFFRYAKIIYETGTLPIIDTMRYVPVGFPTAQFKFFPLTMTYIYKFVHLLFPNVSQIQWHIYYPPVITVISFVFFFLFVKELFNHKIALVSTAFLAVIPAYIQRTSAGFADHEAIAVMWMFIGFWLFALMWKSEDWRKSILFGFIGGIMAAAANASWGGGQFLPIVAGLFVLGALLLARINKEKIMGVIAFALPYGVLIGYWRSWQITLIGFKLLPTIILIFAILCSSAYLFLEKNSKFSIKQLSKPVLAVLIGSLAIIPAQILHIVNIRGLLASFFATNLNRWQTTVAESQQPFFLGSSGWWGEFGYTLIFMILGSLALVWILFKNKSGNNKLTSSWPGMVMAGTYALVMTVFVFGRLSPAHTTLVSFFSSTYAQWLALAVLLFAGTYLYVYYKDRNLFDNTFNVNWVLLLLFIWFGLSLLMSRHQLRLLHMLSPPGAIVIGWFAVGAFEKLRKFKTESFAKVLLVCLVLFSLFAFYSATSNSIGQNTWMGSMMPGQWDNAMTFLREQTPKDSVITHWWDYGHMTIAIGERAAVTDGGNNMPWNYASGRYFLTGKDETSTLEYLKSHNVTHILISEEEIPKYPAFSLIGSDENLDRYSSIGVFTQQQQREVRDGTMQIYGGGWGFDKDLVIGNLILPSGQAAIGGFSVIANNNTLSNPTAYVVYNGQQYQYAVECIYVNGQKLRFEHNTTAQVLNGCLVLAPYIQSQNQANSIGAAFWLSEKVYDTNFARLYMYNETDPNFKLVYSDSTPLGVYQGRVIGPIKIWEVVYPAGIKTDPRYLEFSEYG